MKPKQLRPTILYACLYLLFAVILFVQAFTHVQLDADDFLAADYFISQGLIPHVDFFDAHPLFTNYFFVPFFWLTGNSPAILLVFAILVVPFTFLCAYLSYAIAKKNQFRNPHVASLLFLASYTAIGSYFQRYDFFAMLFILLFFWFDNAFLRGFFLGLLALLSPVTLFAAGVMGLYFLVDIYRYHRETFGIVLAGLVCSALFWRLVQYKTPLAAMYQDVIVFNASIGNLYGVPFLEVFFFSILIEVSLIVAGAYIIWKRWNQSAFVRLAAVFSGAMLFQIVVMNITYGLFTRLKLPALVPILALMIILVTDYKRKMGFLLIAFHLIITFIAFTPNFSLPVLHHYEVASELDACIKPDATMYYGQNRPEGVYRVSLFRKPSEFYWYLREWAAPAGITLPPPAITDGYFICGNTVSKSDLLCDANKLQSLESTCATPLEPTSLWVPLRQQLKQIILD